MTSSVTPVQQAMELFFKREVQIIGPVVSERYHLQEQQIWMSLPKLCSLENIAFISCDQKRPLFTLGTRKVSAPPSCDQKRPLFTLGTRKAPAPPSCNQKRPLFTLGTRKVSAPPSCDQKRPLLALGTRIESSRHRWDDKRCPLLTLGTIKSVLSSPLGLLAHEIKA